MKQDLAAIREEWTRNDAARDAGLTVPEGLTRHLDIAYGPAGEWNLLDVYRPAEAPGLLPTIISFHGGGWFYGDKQLYSNYCMGLAKRGFAVVNFNYRLAPEYRYPAPLEDACLVLHWIRQHGGEYGIDEKNLFLVGDSAGGQLANQLNVMLINPQYRALFPFDPPEGMTIRACGLNCGCYFVPLNRLLSPKLFGTVFESYFPEDYMPITKQLKFREFLTRDYPPAFVMTAWNDYMRMMAKPMYRLLKRSGVEAELHIYGSKEREDIGHVFHMNCRSEEAARCNDQQCEFFRRHVEGS